MFKIRKVHKIPHFVVHILSCIKKGEMICPLWCCAMLPKKFFAEITSNGLTLELVTYFFITISICITMYNKCTYMWRQLEDIYISTQTEHKDIEIHILIISTNSPFVSSCNAFPQRAKSVSPPHWQVTGPQRQLTSQI